MRFSLTVHHGEPFLRVEATGPMTLPDLLGTADLIAAITERTGQKRVLVNLLSIHLDLTFTQHLQLGAYVAGKLENLERVATVATPQNRTGTSEKAAQKSGLNLKTFSDLAEAEAWIAM